jgi:hypothetical protein
LLLRSIYLHGWQSGPGGDRTHADTTIPGSVTDGEEDPRAGAGINPVVGLAVLVHGMLGPRQAWIIR